MAPKLTDMIAILQQNKERVLEVQFINSLKVEIQNSVAIISNEISKELLKLNKNLTMTNILHKKLKIKEKEAKEWSNKLMNFGIVDENGIVSFSNINDLKLKFKNFNI